MSELKPCPLCGSEVGWISGSIRCSRCGLSYGAPVAKEKVERRWNTRPERTCRMRYKGGIPEFVSLDEWTCSECGSPIYNDSEPIFCTFCGARVERGDA